MKYSGSKFVYCLPWMGLVAVAGCSDDTTPTGAVDSGVADSAVVDSMTADSGGIEAAAGDAPSSAETGVGDAAPDASADGGGVDSGAIEAAAGDAPSSAETGVGDAAPDASADGGGVDSGGSGLDAGPMDAGEGGGSGLDAGPMDAGEGGGSVTFTMVYTDIIGPICSGCHAPGHGGFTNGNLDMSTQPLAFVDLVGDAGTGVVAMGTGCGTSGDLRVDPGNASMSLIWEKVNAKLQDAGAPCGSPMPLGSAVLTQAQVNEIAAWINSGAQND
ncbi:MAG: hypothetical protein ABTD50_21140 [Polyangiaceae bacterium]